MCTVTLQLTCSSMGLQIGITPHYLSITACIYSKQDWPYSVVTTNMSRLRSPHTSHTYRTCVHCLYKLEYLTAWMEGQLKVEAAVFDLWLAEGCADVAEQDCFRLSLELTLYMTIRSTRKTWCGALQDVQMYKTRPWIIDHDMTEQSYYSAGCSNMIWTCIRCSVNCTDWKRT